MESPKSNSESSTQEEEEEEFIRIHGYYRGTQGARCYTDGASLQPDESEGCSPVSVVGLIRLCAPSGRLERPAVLFCVAQTDMVSPVGGEQALRYHSLGLR